MVNRSKIKQTVFIMIILIKVLFVSCDFEECEIGIFMISSISFHLNFSSLAKKGFIDRFIFVVLNSTLMSRKTLQSFSSFSCLTLLTL